MNRDYFSVEFENRFFNACIPNEKDFPSNVVDFFANVFINYLDLLELSFGEIREVDFQRFLYDYQVNTRRQIFNELSLKYFFSKYIYDLDWIYQKWSSSFRLSGREKALMKEAHREIEFEAMKSSFFISYIMKRIACDLSDSAKSNGVFRKMIPTELLDLQVQRNIRKMVVTQGIVITFLDLIDKSITLTRI